MLCWKKKKKVKQNMKIQLWDVYLSGRGWIVVSRSSGGDTGSGTRGQHGKGACVPKGSVCTAQTGLCTLQRSPAPGQSGLGNRSAHFHSSQMIFTPDSSASILWPLSLRWLWDCTSQHHSSQTLYAWANWVSNFHAVGRWGCMCMSH